MTYNVKEYWSKRDRPTIGSLDPLITEFISGEIMNAESILDFGPGTGRLFPLYKGKDVVAYDITDKHASSLKTSSMRSFEFTTDINECKGRSFDVVVCCEVLLHQPEDKIVEIMESLSGLGDVVIVVSYWEEEDKELAPHCFKHNYLEILKKMGKSPLKITYIGDQIIFTYA